MTVFLRLVFLVVGVFIGWRLTWMWMERQWQRNPESFKLLVDEVVKKRKREGDCEEKMIGR